jgi:hypothetical protein
MPSPTLVAGCVMVKEAALQSHAALDATGIALGEFVQTSSRNPFGNTRTCGGFSDVEAMRQKTNPIHAPLDLSEASRLVRSLTTT